MRSMQSWQDMPLEEITGESQDLLAQLVQRALDLGMHHLETARAYGSSERQLGEVLSGFSREQLIIQTKVRLCGDAQRFYKDVLDSLTRLQLERVDLLALHGINDYRSLWQACRPGGCLEMARRLQKEGKIGWVGFSGHGSADVILDAVRHEQNGGFDYCNIHWYTIFQRDTPAIKEARKRNLGVFIISPSDKGGMLQKPPQLLRDLSQPLTPMQFNDLFCLSRPEVHTISVGAAEVSDFDEHIAALEFLGNKKILSDITEKWERAMMEASGHVRPDDLWGAFPPWQQTPGYINIAMILWLYNLARGWDLLEYAKSRYQKLGRDMPWVPGNNAELVRRYDLSTLAASAGMENEKLLSLLQDAHALLS